ncbi:MAG: cytochrome P450 [Solirubrobacteraceae bacterium]
MPAPSLPPGPRAPRPVQTLAWGLRPMGFMRRCHDRHGDMFTMRIASEGTWVFVAHPDPVKQVFTGDPAAFHAGEANTILLPVLGPSSVLLLDDAAHMRQRKLLLPPFHGDRMEAYGELMRDIAREEVARWPAHEPIPLVHRMQAITLEVIMRAVFGVEQGPRLDRLRVALRHLLELSVDWRRMAVLAFLGPERAQRLRAFTKVKEPVDALLFEEIAERRDAPGLAERDDILSLLVQARDEDGNPMTDSELRDELMTLLVAGHETTATSLAWAFERLVRHPQVLARLVAEIEAGEDDAYLDAVVKETLRLRPVLPIVIRRLTEPTEVGGRLLPAGAGVVPCIHLLHRRPDVYPDPHRFRPERFLEQPPGTYTWIPFGGGTRRCLGASFAQFEMKQVLSALLTEAAPVTTSAPHEPVGRRAITLSPARGGVVTLAPRGDRARLGALAAR